MLVPNEYHFVFGLKPQNEPFHIVHYLCLESCLQVNGPEAVHFYCHYEPYGPWWERVKERVTVHRVEPEAFVVGHSAYARSQEGMFIRLSGLDYAHQSDFVRLKILQEHGGVYADLDTLFVNPLPAELFRQPFVLGREAPVMIAGSCSPQESICNAIILSQPASLFGQRWLEAMYTEFDGTWSRHSCQAATKLAAAYPEEIHVVPRNCFYKYGCEPTDLDLLLRGLNADYDDVYSLHLWAHLWWDRRRVDFSTFHAGLLTEDYIRRVDTTYNVAARRFLP